MKDSRHTQEAEKICSSQSKQIKRTLSLVFIGMIFILSSAAAYSQAEKITNIRCEGGTFAGVPWGVDSNGDCVLALICNGGASKIVKGVPNAAKTEYKLSAPDILAACGCSRLDAVCCGDSFGAGVCYCRTVWESKFKDQKWPGCQAGGTTAKRKWDSLKGICTNEEDVPFNRQGQDIGNCVGKFEGEDGCFKKDVEQCCPKGAKWAEKESGASRCCLAPNEVTDGYCKSPRPPATTSCSYRDGVLCDYGSASKFWSDLVGSILPSLKCGDKNGFHGKSCSEELKKKWLNTGFMKSVFGFTDKLINSPTVVCNSSFGRSMGGILKPIETLEGGVLSLTFSAKKTTTEISNITVLYDYETSWLISTADYPLTFKVMMRGAGGQEYALTDSISIGINSKREGSKSVSLEKSYTQVCYIFESSISLEDGTKAGKEFCRNFQ